MNRPPPTAVDLALWEALAEAGLTLREIAAQSTYSRTTIGRHLALLGKEREPA